MNNETSIPKKWIYIMFVALFGFLGWVFKSQNKDLRDCIQAKDDIMINIIEFEKEKKFNKTLKSIKNDSIRKNRN